MRIPRFYGPHACFPLLAMFALCTLFLAGCIFGGSDDTSTLGPETDELPEGATAARKIIPGLYLGDYSWIDTNRFAGTESQFLMNADGTFEHLFIYRDDAIFDQSGKWTQKGGSFIFTDMVVSESDRGVFDYADSLEDDTNSVRDVTESAFVRSEWTPIRQKPYWITYKKAAEFPKVSAGAYYHHVIDTFTIVADTSDTTGAVDTVKIVDKLYRFEIGGGDSLHFSMAVDSAEVYQMDARYRQFGSFLVTDNHRDREKDSTGAFTEWQPKDGTIFMKLKDVTDTAFVLQTPAFSSEPDGFLPYSKNGK
jgi:hypothetical protein